MGLLARTCAGYCRCYFKEITSRFLETLSNGEGNKFTTCKGIFSADEWEFRLSPGGWPSTHMGPLALPIY